MLEREGVAVNHPESVLLADSGDGPPGDDRRDTMAIDPSTERPVVDMLDTGLSLPDYRGALVNLKSGTLPVKLKNDWPLESDDVRVDNSGRYPKVMLSDRVKGKLAEGMKHTAVIRLIGRSIGYKSVHFQILRLWKPQGLFQLVELGNNFFMARFDLEMDYLNALTNGPWVIFGFYLTVQPWTQNFNPESSQIDSIVAWIRLPNLPIHLYHKDLLVRIAGAIGKVFKVDHNTSSIDRGKYARFAVGLDLTKPLLPFFELDGRRQRIEYEGLPSICFLCGNVGHLQVACPSNPKPPLVLENPCQPSPGVNLNNAPAVALPPSSSRTVSSPVRAMGVEAGTPPEEAEFGPWMQVPRKDRRAKGSGKENMEPSAIQQETKKGGRSGSRFDLLASKEGKSNCHGQSINETNPSPSTKGWQKKQSTNCVMKSGGKVVGPIPTLAVPLAINTQFDPPPSLNNSPVSSPKPRPPKASHVPCSHVDNRTSLAPHPPTNRVLDPSKHTVAYISDDLVHYSNSSFLMDFSSTLSEPSVPNKENSFRHPSGPGIDRRRGVNLSKNPHKALKVKNLKNTPPQHSEKLKKAILNSLSDITTIDPGSL